MTAEHLEALSDSTRHKITIDSCVDMVYTFVHIPSITQNVREAPRKRAVHATPHQRTRPLYVDDNCFNSCIHRQFRHTTVT